MHKAKKVSGNDATKQTKMQQKKRKKVRNKLQKMSGQIRSRKQELAMYYRNTMHAKYSTFAEFSSLANKNPC